MPVILLREDQNGQTGYNLETRDKSESGCLIAQAPVLIDYLHSSLLSDRIFCIWYNSHNSFNGMPEGGTVTVTMS